MTSHRLDIPFHPPASKDVVLHTRVVSDTGGGPEKTILLSSPFLADSNYALAAAYMHPPDDPGFEVIRQRAVNWNSPLISIPDRGATDVRVLRDLLRLCKQFNVKIWHAHDYKSNLFGLLLRPFHRMKLVTTVHGWVVQTSKTPLYYKVDKLCLPRYQHVICVSDDLLDEVAKLKIRSDRLTYIPNAIDELSFSRQGPSSAAAMRRQRAVPNDRVLVGASGRLMPEKSFDLLIRATKTLLNEGHPVELWIAGEGSARQDLERLIVELDLADHVKLLGFWSDTKAFYESLDLFVLSSQREGLPNVILEAAAMGVPIVSTRVAGVPKMLTDDHDGLLCDIGNQKGLTDAMRRLVCDPVKRSQMAIAARKLVEEQYSFRKRMDRIQTIYERLLGR
ncbi:Alpha-D-kanosaminyltransferase [Novipirellula aureliae]|uniref:Alpha-D-kanosaminyltransferase n=1 Tax=Novipirellula aureliae TaxID=2527966 RepID=A0A5C6E3W0_9BACT|nr:glycosyltransferase family 4 protein [Novipirellula aureliae]TWU44353.1 Alpha-D-kanosaminyltransferase [Novipirellula aureliae]